MNSTGASHVHTVTNLTLMYQFVSLNDMREINIVREEASSTDVEQCTEIHHESVNNKFQFGL